MRALLLSFAEHLGVSPDDAAPVLEEVVALLAEEVATTGRATLDGVGTFETSGSGAQFAPDELLLATVNGDYAGLGTLAEPAPIAVPFLTAFPVVPVTAEESVPEPVLVTQPPIEEVLLPVGDEQADRTGDDSIDDDLAAAMAGEWTSPPSPPVAPLESTNSGTAGGDSMAFEDAEFSFVASPARRSDAGLEQPSPFTSIASAAPFAATATTQPTTPLAPVAYADDRPRRGAIWWALPVLALVAVATWLFTRGDGTPSASGEAPAGEIAQSGNSGRASGASGGGAVGQTADPAGQAGAGGVQASGPDPVTAPGAALPDVGPPQQPAPAATTPAPRTLVRDEPQTPPQVQRPEADQPATVRPAPAPAPQRRAATRPAARQTVRESQRPDETERATQRVQPATPSPTGTLYGLTGGGTVDPGAGGATWILNSTSASEAAGQADRYRSLGFRSSVLTAVVDGRRVHRVAVGQFPGVAEARAARSLLPPDAPADAWILRLGNAP